jgi:hypothetical protein
MLEDGENSLPSEKNRAEIILEMTDIIVGHLETLPNGERKQRVRAFKKAISGKRAHGRAKAATTSRTPRKSRRIPA